MTTEVFIGPRQKLWVVYDERAVSQGTDEAAVFVACGSYSEAKRDAWEFAGDYGCAVVYEYDVEPETKELVNEQQRKIVRRR